MNNKPTWHALRVQLLKRFKTDIRKREIISYAGLGLAPSEIAERLQIAESELYAELLQIHAVFVKCINEATPSRNLTEDN